jgi:hypothetical protein
MSPCQRNHVMTVPGGAVIVAIEYAPRFTTPGRSTLAVTSPRSPGPTGLQARLIRIPRVTKSWNALVALFSLSDWHAATANSAPIAVVAVTSITASPVQVALVIAASVLRIVVPFSTRVLEQRPLSCGRDGCPVDAVITRREPRREKLAPSPQEDLRPFPACTFPCREAYVQVG